VKRPAPPTARKQACDRATGHDEACHPQGSRAKGSPVTCCKNPGSARAQDGSKESVFRAGGRAAGARRRRLPTRNNSHPHCIEGRGRSNSSIRSKTKTNHPGKSDHKDLNWALDKLDEAAGVKSFVDNPAQLAAQAIKTALIQGACDHFHGILAAEQQKFSEDDLAFAVRPFSLRELWPYERQQVRVKW
jgi:hypothetical protein